ncbi:MAG: sensor histidine kinase [Opitutaceae bacterium]|nr:sensor histidine kinase [Opitutaceae bacterium]
MNPLPRFVATALFLVLAALVALLAVPLWQGSRAAATAPPAANAAGTDATPKAAPPGPTGAMRASQRVALFLAVLGAALALTLIVSPSLRPSRVGDGAALSGHTRAEVGTLARLAESSVAQGEELSRERDVRRRAEEDARLKQQLLTRSLDEKIRLGHDLHDGIIQSLYAAGLMLESVRTLVKANPAEAERRLEETRASLNGAIRDVRAYIVGLAPENLRRAGFAHGLSALVADLRAGREVRLDIQIDDEAAGLLTPEQSLEVLQIAREAVSNALRHGAATLIVLRLQHSDREVGLSVQDNGKGFIPAAARDGGHGLGNMQARADRLGASLRLTSTPGEGTRVVATVPIRATGQT